ncbi:RHS repeat-associated core domain-containing protein [Nocardiopsis deserti]|uniref:RHS repeat-associated core domain-containing protein n=1 Tax=Nocardiopsis deserti TaxID=2605988 RepID=UPI00123968BC|nr:RHS repeat-associated core domain-containing protein [Nocardiopsis deserti]
MRENDGDLHWVFSDHHGTGEMAVDAVWGEVVQRRMTVFGENREAAGDWPGERGFVDGTVDESTGLTQLGARAYDAALGRFVSVDPLLNLADAQSMNGYAYANNSPATYWDGNGLAAWDIQQMKARENYLRNTGYYDSPAPKKKSKNSSSVSITVSITVYPGGGVRTNWTRMNYGPNVTSPYLMSTPTYKAPANYWNGPVKSPKEEAIEDATWLSQAGDWVSGAWNSAADWTTDNWGTISQVASWAAFGACVFVSAGACLAAGGAVLAANVWMDHQIDGSVNVKEHAWSALMLGMGRGAALGVGRLAAGTWRGALSSMRSRPTVRTGTQRWDYNPRSGNPQRREGIFQGWDMNSGPVDWGASSANYAVNIASGSTFGGPVPYSNPFAGR